MTPWNTDSVYLIAADAIAALSYFMIAGYVWLFWYAKKDHLPGQKGLFAVGLMIFIRACVLAGMVCGLWVYADIRYFMAPLMSAVAAYGAFAITRLVVYFKQYKLPDEYRAELLKLKEQYEKERQHFHETEEKVRQINHDLAGQVQALQNQLHLQGWIVEKQVDLDKMKAVITDLRKTYAGTDQTTP